MGTRTPAAWVVRAGRHGEREEEALASGCVIVGWPEVGDLSSINSREELRAKLAAVYPRRNESVLANWTGQLWRFIHQIQPGDLVVLPSKNREGQLAIGRIDGPYQHRAGGGPDEVRHLRPVVWLRTDLSRNSVRPDLLNSLGSLLTVFGLSRYGAAKRISRLADEGVDPGRPTHLADGRDSWKSRDQFLDLAAEKAISEPLALTISELLDMWGAGRRTDKVVSQIEADLADRGLTTRPPFTEGWIHNSIRIVPLGDEPEPESKDDVATDARAAMEPAATLPPVSLRVGDLQSAAGGVLGVTLGDSLVSAVTLMLIHNYSQLAVFDADDTFFGAVSWESIGKARLAAEDPSLSSATANVRVVEHDESLLSQIGEIYDRGYVFVRGSDHRTVTGIVTAADLTQQFGNLARPFVLIEEVERRLRRRVDETFSLDALRRVAKRPRATTSAADFTLGDYEHLLKEQADFNRLGWPLDHSHFVSRLREVREIRNELMHFSPDPLTERQLELMEGFLNVLRSVDPRP